MERQLIDMAIKRRQPLPNKIANAPALLDGLGLYYDAFLELSTDRAVGMGIGPIPWSSINRYAECHGLVGDDDYGDLRDMVRAMDGAFLKYEAQRQKDKQSAEAIRNDPGGTG